MTSRKKSASSPQTTQAPFPLRWILFASSNGWKFAGAFFPIPGASSKSAAFFLFFRASTPSPRFGERVGVRGLSRTRTKIAKSVGILFFPVREQLASPAPHLFPLPARRGEDDSIRTFERRSLEVTILRRTEKSRGLFLLPFFRNFRVHWPCSFGGRSFFSGDAT